MDRSMNSKDILSSFFSDATFEGVCSREKFSKECASSLGPETASRLYDIISEQHEAKVESVQKSVGEGEFLPETHKIDKKAEFGRFSQNTSILGLVLCLLEAVELSEAHSAILDQNIKKEIEIAQQKKNTLMQLVNEFKTAETELDDDTITATKLAADKCIAVLRNDMRSR